VSANYSRTTKSLVELATFQPQADALTYEPYFGLTEKPFSLNADPRFVYDSPTYGATRESVVAGIRRREGLLVLTGEIGTGKTTLCRTVIRDLGRKTYSSIVPDPFASREDLLKMLLIDFGVLSIQELTTGPLRQASRTELGYLLSEFLDSLAPDAFVVVILDEAQNLSLPLIEETRILSDTFGANGRLQIVYVGQPELHAKLKLPEMRQVDQRVCGYYRLAPMSRDAVAGYIQHRLQVAGGRRDRALFPSDIGDCLHRRCGGVPRLINRVCDRALQLAYERKTDVVDREILDTALIEVGAATLSPTWDSIIFAESQTPRSAPVAAPTPTAAPTVQIVDLTPPIDGDQIFKSEVDNWAAQDLAPPPPPGARTPRPVMAVDEKPVALPAQRRPASRTASRRETPARTVTTDWPRDLRSETYLQRLWRKWAKRVAIGLAVFVVLNAAVVGASVLLDSLMTPPVLPALPEAPVVALPGLAPPQASATIALDEPPSVAAASVTDSAEYLVTVGLFASRDHADQVVDALTQAGLPAMERPFQLRQQQVRQIALGPFFSRSEAVAGLRRLQALGGYDDASVISQ
jgi:type II secretory pathway predicted ATPase ExeA/cell division septation protein DedD